MAGKFRSNEDLTRAISKSIFVTNFPVSTSAKDLWNLCSGYGTVVDVYIPNRLSKTGKRFAFVRFIKVVNVDRLVGNLRTLWIGRMHIHANEVRFARPPRAAQTPHPPKHVASGTPSFTSAVKGPTIPSQYISPSPALVLDDSCVVNRDWITVLWVKLRGGLWVMIELHSIQVKAKFMSHVGIASWFGQLCSAQPDFVSRERIVWVDIEGDPLHAWSRESFCKIGSKWGEEDNILERFKIIIRGKVYNVRAKELAVWTPSFNEVNVNKYCSDDESVKGSDEVKDESCKHRNSDVASDVEEVSDTFFGGSDVKNDDTHDQVLNSNAEKNSPDPFNIYDLLTKKSDRMANSDKDSSLPFPPGFTPNRDPSSIDSQKANAPPSNVHQMQTNILSS
ncbi:RNA-directed DNA polymerase, eukaryota [Tanacetum coccineum]